MSAMDFETAIERVLGHEGGYVNHPDDPGGETNWGITRATADAWGYDGRMVDMSRDEAKDIYYRAYWLPLRPDEFNGALAFQLFDSSVNHGQRNAVKFLQRASGSSADGVIGPNTIEAANNLTPSDCVCRFNAERLEFYTSLSTFDTFGRGWSNRVAGNLNYAGADLVTYRESFITRLLAAVRVFVRRLNLCGR